ncbi:MAG: hypothetical protein H0V10_09855 [Geodermatophilaceae bacterium]|nr:hypothetical protein [Geodermatophilaceae bacterium]
MDEMRRPLFVIALVLLVCVVGVEIGSSLFIAPAVTTGAGLEAALDAADIDEDDRPSQEEREALAETDDPPGLAIPMLALIDGLLLLSMLGLGAALVIRHRIQGRIVAPVNLVVSFLLILAAIILVIVMLVLLFLMIGLFLAAPFGTITYLIRWGFFPRGEAQVTLRFCGRSSSGSPDSSWRPRPGCCVRKASSRWSRRPSSSNCWWVSCTDSPHARWSASSPGWSGRTGSQHTRARLTALGGATIPRLAAAPLIGLTAPLRLTAVSPRRRTPTPRSMRAGRRRV